MLEEQIDDQFAVPAADAIDQIGVGGAQFGGDVGVFGDLQGGEVDLGEEWRWQVVARKILGDVAPAEALAKVGIMGGRRCRPWPEG